MRENDTASSGLGEAKVISKCGLGLCSNHMNKIVISMGGCKYIKTHKQGWLGFLD